MEKKPSNPPAFARSHGTDNYDSIQEGMSLRDYFAAKAMQAIVSTTTNPSYSNYDGSTGVAIHAYRMADAMLAERERSLTNE